MLAVLAVERFVRRWRPGLVVDALNLAPLLPLVLFFYIAGNYGDYRLLSIHLLLSTLLWVASHDAWMRRLALLVLVFDLLMTPLFLAEYQRWRPAYDGTFRHEILTFADLVAEPLAYRPGADPWCNTLGVLYEEPLAYPVELAGVPAGIGITTYFDVERPGPRKPRFLLMMPARLERLAQRARMQVLLSLETSNGPALLCRNVDVSCE